MSRVPATGSAADFLPERRTLPALRAAAASCHGCPLWARGTQTVFGEGPRRARAMLVGEQPGHEEDLAGKPFVGPAGRVLDRALEAAGIARTDVYVTNVVKHFKWVPKGKRRIHAKPNQMEICRGSRRSSTSSSRWCSCASAPPPRKHCWVRSSA